MSNNQPCALVILAGGSNKFAEKFGVASKTLLKINNQSICAITADACYCAQEYHQRIIVGNQPDDLPDPSSWFHVPDQKSMLANIVAGTEAVTDKSNRILLSTSDLPWLTSDAVSDFIKCSEQRIQSSKTDVVFPFNELNVCTTRFPGLKRTAVKLKDARVTGGNLCYARNVDKMLILASKLQPIIAARKNVFKLAACFGFGFIVRLIFQQVTIEQLCQRAFELTGLNFSAFSSKFPEIGSDIDNEKSYLYALKWFDALD